MVKHRVGVRLKTAVGAKKSLNHDENLTQLTARYQAFCKRLRALIVALKAHYASMHHVAKTRHEVREDHVGSGTKHRMRVFLPCALASSFCFSRTIFSLLAMNVMFFFGQSNTDAFRCYYLFADLVLKNGNKIKKT